ncbi:MAG: DUF3040 domain-containing protein [Actinomycetia bacterium]|nr:DUF3040 domain-containing protein [Actinomycetes bacterium]
MPLSDREQQLLEQMERALLEDDPKFASSMRGGPGQARNRKRLAVGIGGGVLGLAVVLLGVTMQQPIIGAVGFAVMVASVVFALTERKPQLHAVPEPGQPSRPAKGGKKKGPGGGSSSFMNRLEERWDKRREQGGF